MAMISDRYRRHAAAASLAAAIAVPCEGLYYVYYFDPPGIPTVCFGHTGPDVDKGKRYSLAECKALLTKDMAKAIDAVDRCQPGLPEKILAAFGDATYNMGPTIACNTDVSTAARLLKADKLEAACRQLPRWNKAKVAGVLITLGGLTRRRMLEMRLCLDGVRDYQATLVRPLIEQHNVMTGRML